MKTAIIPILIAIAISITGCRRFEGVYMVYHVNQSSSLESFASKLIGRKFNVQPHNGFVILTDISKNRELIMAAFRDDNEPNNTIYATSEHKNGVTLKYKLIPNNQECDLLLLIDLDTQGELSKSEREYLDIRNNDNVKEKNGIHFAQVGGVIKMGRSLTLKCYLSKLN